MDTLEHRHVRPRASYAKGYSEYRVRSRRGQNPKRCLRVATHREECRGGKADAGARGAPHTSSLLSRASGRGSGVCVLIDEEVVVVAYGAWHFSVCCFRCCIVVGAAAIYSLFRSRARAGARAPCRATYDLNKKKRTVPPLIGAAFGLP